MAARAEKLNWLVIGIGDITTRRVIPAIQAEPRSNLYGGSRETAPRAHATRIVSGRTCPSHYATGPSTRFTWRRRFSCMRLSRSPRCRPANTSSARNQWQ